MDPIALAAYKKAKGAAPAGYGLGEGSSLPKEWNAATQNGFIREDDGSPDGEWWFGINCKDYGNYTAQIAFKRGVVGDPVVMAIRKRAGSIFGEWEYVNPPMLPGVEYCTTDRWKGKVVYTKLIDLPIVSSDINEGALHFDELASGVDTVVSAEYREIDGEMIHFGDRLKELTVSAGVVSFSIFDVEPDTITEATLLLKYTK